MRVFWYCPLKIFTSFEEKEDNPSFRLRCLNTHMGLLKNGHYSKIVESTSEIIDPDIIVFLSFGEEELELAKWAKLRGTSLIHDYSENIRGIPVLEETKKLCDRIVCCSTVLSNFEKVVYGDRVVVVRDPIEESPVVHNYRYTNDRIKVVWMGMGGNAGWVTQLLKPLVEELDMKYIEISNRPEADIPWGRDTWKKDMASCDIALCPQIHWQFPAKSNVKVTTALGLRLPVIASPIQSYTEIIVPEHNGFICHELDQWRGSLIKLKDRDTRELQVLRAEERLHFYDKDFIYKEWENVFKGCLRR